MTSFLKPILILTILAAAPLFAQHFQTGSASISADSPSAQQNVGPFTFEFRADNITDSKTPAGTVKTMSNILVKVNGSFLANVEGTTRSGTVVRHVKDKQAISLQINNVDVVKTAGGPLLKGAAFTIVVNPN